MKNRAAEASLVRALGTWALAAGIVNVTIGGGIFRLPAAAAQTLGAAAPLAYVVCAVAMGLIVLCFAEAGSRVSLTGGLYAYTEVAFGPFAGFLTGLILWAGITSALAAVSSFFADAFVALVPSLGAGVGRTTALVLVLVALAALNIAGVRGASRFNAVMTVAKLLPLVILIVAGIGAIKPEHLAWAGPPKISSVARASAVLIFAFLGVEAALVPSGEVRDSARTVPRAIFIAMTLVTVLYLVIQLVAQGILGPALATQATPLAEAAGVALGPWGRGLILVGSAISMFGYVSGMTLSVPRMLFAFGRDGFLPGGLASVHERFHTPHVAIVVQTLIVIALAVSGTFEKLVVLANGSVLIVYGVCCGAVLELRRRDVRTSPDAAPFRAPAGGAVPVLALGIIAWLLTSLTLDEWKALGVVIVAGIVIYFVGFSARRASRPVGLER